jgi:hypothetical protein
MLNHEINLLCTAQKLIERGAKSIEEKYRHVVFIPLNCLWPARAPVFLSTVTRNIGSCAPLAHSSFADPFGDIIDK